MNPNNKEWMVIAVLVLVIMYFGMYIGRNDPKYRYFERDNYVVRYKASTNEACIIPESQDMASAMEMAGRTICKAPWLSRTLGL